MKRRDPSTLVTRAELCAALSYDPLSGQFRWRKDIKGGVKAGDVAGSPDDNGYIDIRLNGRLYPAHCLAWLYMTGEWPAGEVDHRDLNKGNNVWTNLREATKAQNKANSGPNRNSLSGIKGVSFDPRTKKWRARIMVERKERHLGTFETAELARAARQRADIEIHGEFARTAP